MDSIERMRRINDLTKELKQRGFAESSFEAIQQANQIYGPDDLDDHVRNGIIKNSPQDKMVQDENMSNENVSYDNRKLDKINESVETLTNKMNEIIRAINELDARITEVKQKQDKLILMQQEPRSEPKRETRVEVNVEEAPARTESAPEKKQESQTPKDEYSVNQRTGNFQSQDVAIDKMFYFGKK